MVLANRKKRKKPAVSDPFYPNHLLRMAMVITGALAVVTLLGAVSPAPIGQPALPGSPQEDAALPWIIEPVRLLGDLLPGPAWTVWAILAGGLIFLCLPFVDRYGDVRRLRRAVARALFMTLAAIVALLYLAGLIQRLP